MNTLTKAQERKIRLDLQKKIRSLYAQEQKAALEKLDSLIASGSGVLQDHHSNGLNYLTAHLFREAMKLIPGWEYSKAEKKLAKNYHLMM
jgi:hypothetical protein